MGRPSRYLPEYDEEAKGLCLLGYTDVQLAENFGVCEGTIHEWKKKHPSFFKSIKEGKSVADRNVAMAMYKSAMGFRYDEVTYEKVIQELDGISEDGDIKMDVYKKKVVTKEVTPDTRAGMFWLKNRQPKHWRDKIDATVTNINSAPMTKEEILEISKALENDC